MRKFLKGMLVIIIIAVIGVVAYTVKHYLDDKEQVNALENSQKEGNASGSQANVDDGNEKKDDELIKDNGDGDEVKEGEDNEPVNEETSMNDDEKAMNLAKKAYGTTDGVYFRIEQMQSNSVYIVSVRDNETTRDLAWYTVDVKNGTVK